MRLIAARREEILASTADDVAHVGKEDMKGRDLLTLLIRSNMASDLEDGERMSEDEILARECFCNPFGNRSSGNNALLFRDRWAIHTASSKSTHIYFPPATMIVAGHGTTR